MPIALYKNKAKIFVKYYINLFTFFVICVTIFVIIYTLICDAFFAFEAV